ncbi:MULTISPECIES: GNAT family N-acetyltransferase [Streptomyces]|uniref:GNAT family N-acetyltransferase n=1 Tax=Streptomyces TaxID=1883 RepID=UPI0006896927|nr:MULTISPECIES: GNAT family N-acetyltransferase [Streptomyces]MDP9954190.1 RimJ/RimL family protein N-acetyltransferase [Streptomyces sp. DSM 41269]
MNDFDRPTLFTHSSSLGTLAIHPLDPAADRALLHSWVTHPKAAYWLMQDQSPQEVEHFYREVAAHPHHEAFVGTLNGTPCFLIERYDPKHVELAGLYPARQGDIGMHFLCAPTDRPRHGFSRAVITAVMAYLFDDPAVRRVVVEPDLRNTAVHALNAAVGFVPQGPLAKPEKEALLSFCTREQFRAATEGNIP